MQLTIKTNDHRVQSLEEIKNHDADLNEIPRYIHKTAGEGVYDYFLGFHGLDLAEPAFYAIPKNCRRKECLDENIFEL